MYRYFDIDDLGNTSVMRGNELDEFESFSPEWKEYQKRWKELEAGGMSKKDAKAQAKEELNYKPGQKLFQKAKDLLEDKGNDETNGKKDPAVEGGSQNDAGASTPPPATAGMGGLGGNITIAGMQVPTIAILGVAGVAAWYFMKKK